MTKMAGDQRWRVRVLGLGDVDERALAPFVRELRAAWDGIVDPAIACAGAGRDRRAAARTIRGWCDGGGADVVLTVGCGGHRAEDFAPELTRPLLERELPGVEERMCLAAPRRPEDLLFRGCAGLRGTTLVVNLPDRPARVRAIARMLAPVIGHALEKARGSDRECGHAGGGR
jgi:molybdopterin biosynthesis enzyme MoaB